MGRIFWVIYSFFILVQKVVLPFFFWLLAITTAREDTGELLTESSEMLEALNGNIALDLLLLAIGAVGLVYSFGSGNWRLALHRYASRPRLARLRDDARRTAEDISSTLSQQRITQEQSWVAGDGINRPNILQDGRFLAKHMMEAHSIFKRLEDVGYWHKPNDFMEIGVAGPTHFAAEGAAKALYTASEKIRCDLEDGFITLLTKPQ